MFPDSASGFQHAQFNAASQLCMRCEAVVQFCTCYFATHPGTYHSLFTSPDPLIYPLDGSEPEPKFDRPLFDDSEETEARSSSSDTQEATRDDPALQYSQAEVVPDPLSPDHLPPGFDDILRSISSPTGNFSSLPMPNPPSPAFIAPYSIHVVPDPHLHNNLDIDTPQNLKDLPVDSVHPSPLLTDIGENDRTENPQTTIDPSYLAGVFNFGDRFDGDLGMKQFRELAHFRFGDEQSTLEVPPHYPSRINANSTTNTPFGSPQLSRDNSTLFTDERPSTSRAASSSRNIGSSPSPGKFIYEYTCERHHLFFDRKERTIAHFNTVHKRYDVNITNAHPCSQDDCDKSFRHPKDLRKHQPTHTKTKDHVCVCGKEYTRRDNLQRHQHGNPKTKAPACDDFLESQKRLLA